MDISEQIQIDDIYKRFSVLPNELGELIENRKVGIVNPEYAEWDEYDVRILEKALKLIRRKVAIELLKYSAEIIISAIFILTETYVTMKAWFSPYPLSDAQIVIVNLKMVSLATIPLLIIRELVTGGDTGPYMDSDTIQIKVFRSGVRIIIGTIIFLDFINLFVGAY